MNEETVQLFINDIEVSAPKGAMLITVTDQHAIDVPRFCYHKKLSVAANCRMCMVEVEKAPKPLPACATPVAEGMKVYTKSAVALGAQKSTMEFLLINHPLDCPVCDQGGECELQDIAMGYGEDISRYTESKRVVPDKQLGPLVSTDMTRCIHCTRCVRFGTEIAGVGELGAFGRGEFMQIGTYVERSLRSELSGNIIDICPVGALNAKPSRMHARAWEMLQSPSIAPHDSVGSNIYIHTLRNKPVRVVPRENEEVNETWISDRDRFSYEGLQTTDRATQPLIKSRQGWQARGWDTCLEQLVTTVKRFAPDQIGVLAAPHSTLEELYLLQKIFRFIGVQNIDHRTRQVDFSDQESMPLFPYLGQSIEALEHNDVIFLIGSDIRLEQPMLAHRMRKASARGSRLLTLNPQAFDFHFANQDTWNIAPQQWLRALAEIAKCAPSAAIQKLPLALHQHIEKATVSEPAQQIFDWLNDAKQSSVFTGALADLHPQASAVRALAAFIATGTQSKFGMFAPAGNTAGAWLVGAVPHRLVAGTANPNPGLNAMEMQESPIKAYVLFNLEPEFDFNNTPALLQALKQAEFVVMVTPYVTKPMREYADVILPITTFAETEGTYVNTEGRWQSVNKSVPAPKDARPGWRILRVLANKFGIEDAQYQSCANVREEIKQYFTQHREFNSELSNFDNINLNTQQASLYRVSSVPIYAVDNVVRRARSLQATPYAQQPHVAMCEQQARELGLLQAARVSVRQDNQKMTLELKINQTLPMHCVWIQKSAAHMDLLGPAIAPVEIKGLAND